MTDALENNLDGTNDEVSPLDSEKDPAGDPGTADPSGEKTKEPSEKTYTQKQVDTILSQRHSKLDTTVNGLKAEVSAIPELRAKIDALEKERNDARLEAAKDDPARLMEIIKEDRANKSGNPSSGAGPVLTEDEAKTVVAMKVAEDFGIEFGALTHLTTVEAMRTTARLIATSKEAGGKKAPTKKEVNADPGKGPGDSGPKTALQKNKERYPSMFPGK